MGRREVSVGCLVYLGNAERVLGLDTQNFAVIVVKNGPHKNYQWMLSPGETREAGCAQVLQMRSQRLGIK